MKSKQELIQQITADFDAKRKGWYGRPYFELYEFIQTGFVAPELPVFEIRISGKKIIARITFYIVLTLVYGYVIARKSEGPEFTVITSLLILGLCTYYGYQYFKKVPFIRLDPESLTLENKISIPWKDLLTIHFLGRLRYSETKLIVHYLDEFGLVQERRVGIDNLEYKPREIGAVVQGFMKRQISIET